MGISVKLVKEIDLYARMENLRSSMWTLVATGGCFDLLHIGHIRTLEYAASLGGVLIVLVNSDDSVRRLKGNSRPIIPLPERLETLAALACVDYVVPFEESTPERVLKIIRPDFWVKSTEYQSGDVIERDVIGECGGQIRFSPHVHDHSTTNLIERIRLGG